MKNINGVDTEAFKKTCGLIVKDPSLAKSQFRVHNTWISGGNNKVNVQGFWGAGKEQVHGKNFEYQADEPPVLMGKDIGANPVEYLLCALSSCMTTSIVYHAANHGITIESIDSDFKGDLDLQGFLNLSNKVPKGYQKIEANFKVRCNAPLDTIAEFYKYSPVWSMVSKAVPIEVTFRKG